MQGRYGKIQHTHAMATIRILFTFHRHPVEHTTTAPPHIETKTIAIIPITGVFKLNFVLLQMDGESNRPKTAVPFRSFGL